MAVDEPAPVQVDSWQAAEMNAAEWMRHWGFTGAGVTHGGADAGIDVSSRTGIAQVKSEAAQVGRPALQRLVGARGRSDKVLLFFTGFGYTRQALEYANEMDIALFKYALDGRMTPANGPAKSIVDGASVPVESDPLREASVGGDPRSPEHGQRAGAGCLTWVGVIGLLLPILWLFQDPGYAQNSWWQNTLLVAGSLTVGVLALSGADAVRRSPRTGKHRLHANAEMRAMATHGVRYGVGAKESFSQATMSNDSGVRESVRSVVRVTQANPRVDILVITSLRAVAFPHQHGQGIQTVDVPFPNMVDLTVSESGEVEALTMQGNRVGLGRLMHIADRSLVLSTQSEARKQFNEEWDDEAPTA